MSATSQPLAISLTLPGSASLGAFQAGAVSAVARAVHELRAHGVETHVTAIGGSSAGSIVGLLAAHCLMTGRNVRSMMQTAWVDEVDMDLLRSGGSEAPLSFHGLREKLIAFLSDYDRFPREPGRQLDWPITFQVGLTSLLGYEIDNPGDSGRIGPTISYVDWTEHRITPEHDTGDLYQDSEATGPTPLDTVLTSAAHPLGFKSSALDRSNDRDCYRDNRVQNLPEDHTVLWYADGGLIEGRPVGRIVSASRNLVSETLGSVSAARLLHLVIDPLASGPAGQAKWAEPESNPGWIDVVRRSMAIVPTQPLHDDIRGVIEVNTGLQRFEQLRDSGGLDEATAQAVLEWAGMSDKVHVELGVISPRGLETGGGVDELLTGDFVGAFGGFLKRSIRASDFALGWVSAAHWFTSYLPEHEIEAPVIEAVEESLEHDFPDARDLIITGDDGIDVLDWKGRWRLALLAAQFGRVTVAAATPSLPSRSD
ncbi:MAG: hypothetical protein HKN24_09845 [Acidimicrobiales bacterium]|nr:hypothetical protein [Acidimicrobiales bacterium]